jgi:hypothetical protein
MTQWNIDSREQLKDVLRSLVPKRYRPIEYLTRLAKTQTRMYIAI